MTEEELDAKYAHLPSYKYVKRVPSWKRFKNNRFWVYCSECGYSMTIKLKKKPDFCPYCRMNLRGGVTVYEAVAQGSN